MTDAQLAAERARLIKIINSADENTDTAAKNALVLEFRKKEQETDGEEGTVQAVILAVTPEEAEVLAYAFLRGCFHLTLCPFQH